MRIRDRKEFQSFGRSVVEGLQDAGASKHFRRLILNEVGRSNYDGWWSNLAALRGGGTLSVWFDASADADQRDLWYGFTSPDWRRVGVIAKASASVLDQDVRHRDPQMTILRSQYGRVVQERFRGSEYYAGVYVPGNQLTSISAAVMAKRIARLGEGVARSLGSRPNSDRAAQGYGEITKRIRREILARQGQRQFRLGVLERFENKCCVSRCGVRSVLEAAHITPKDGRDDHSIKNGLLLRADIHTLFDLGHIAIEPTTLRVQVSPELRNSAYADFDGKRLRAPKGARAVLDRVGLRRRWDALGWTQSRRI